MIGTSKIQNIYIGFSTMQNDSHSYNEKWLSSSTNTKPTKAKANYIVQSYRLPQHIIKTLAIMLLILCSIQTTVFGEELQGYHFGHPNITNYEYGVTNTTMGGASAAIANDQWAAFTNPAGLVNMNFTNIAYGYHLLPLKNHLGYLGFVKPRVGPKENLAIGIAGAYNTIQGDMTVRDDSGSETGDLSNHAFMGMFTLAYRLGDNPKSGTLLGVNVKYAHEIFDDNQTINAGIDAGILLPKAIPFISIGAAFSNILMVYNVATGKVGISNPKLKISISTSDMEWGRIAIQIDKNLMTQDMIKFHIGGYFRIFAKAKFGNDPEFNQLPPEIFDDVLDADGEAPPDRAAFQQKKGILGSKYQSGLWLMVGYNSNRFTAGFSSILFGVVNFDVGVLMPSRFNKTFGLLTNIGFTF